VNFELFDHEVDSDTHVIELRGEVDLYTAPPFKQRLTELIEGNKTRFVIDLSRATFIDSTGLSVLANGLTRLQSARGSLALVCADETMLEIFDVTGLDRAFPIYDTRNEALAAAVGGG
jgi:anti-sigma B factor antagonist